MAKQRQQAAQKGMRMELDWLDKATTALVDGSLALIDDM